MNDKKTGAPFKFTANELQEKFEDYKIWLSNQSYIKKIWDNKAGCEQKINLPKPPTIQSFCLFVDINRTTYYDLINAESVNISEDLYNMITRINDWITDYQITGAMLNELNPLIVSRMNGLNDTVNVQVNEQPVVNININALTGRNNSALNENNIQDIEFEVMDPIELRQNNDI